MGSALPRCRDGVPQAGEGRQGPLARARWPVHRSRARATWLMATITRPIQTMGASSVRHTVCRGNSISIGQAGRAPAGLPGDGRLAAPGGAKATRGHTPYPSGPPGFPVPVPAMRGGLSWSRPSFPANFWQTDPGIAEGGDGRAWAKRLIYGAGGGSRTRRCREAHRILSPARLPVPPPRHAAAS